MKITVHKKNKKLKQEKIVTNAFLLFVLSAIIMLLMSACGPQQIDVTGTVTHKIELDLSKLESYFRIICEREQPDNVEECTSRMVTDFLNSVL